MTVDPDTARVERVARAICEADVLAPDPDDPIYLGLKAARAWEARIQMARAAIAAADEWEPIETAPRNDTDILVATENRMVRVAFFDTARGGVWSMWPGRERTYPVAWKPLPAPPQEKADD